MSRLDDLINEMSKDFVPDEKKEESKSETDKKLKEFFFSEMQTPQIGDGRCTRCFQDMRIHLSTFICDNCETKRQGG